MVGVLVGVYTLRFTQVPCADVPFTTIRFTLLVPTAASP